MRDELVKIRKWFNENVEVVAIDCFEIFSLGQTVVSCVVLCTIVIKRKILCKKISIYDSLLLSYYFFLTTSFVQCCISYHFLQAHSA